MDEIDILSTSQRKKVASKIKKLVYQGRQDELKPALETLEADEYLVLDLAFFKGFSTDVEARRQYPFSIGKWSYNKSRALSKLGQFLLSKNSVRPA